MPSSTPTSPPTPPVPVRSAEMLALLAGRRSAKPQMLSGPGPSPAQLEQILSIAARVPDHKKLVPWRFVVFEGEARQTFGEALARIAMAEEAAPPSEVRLATERGRFMRAPLVVAVISRTVENPGAPEWEQILSAGAAAFNLCLAANALGYATCWITEWYAYSPGVRAELGLAPNERIAGFVYVGSAATRQDDRERPALADIVTRYGA